MRVLVTGGAGYIGSTLVPLLLEKGYEVDVVDNFMYRQTPLLASCQSPKLNIVRGDVRDDRVMKPLLAKADSIIPLACLVGAPICDQDPVGARTINFESIQWLLNAKSKSQQMIFPTTNSGYGIGEEGIHCTEDTPLRPVSLYGGLKVEIENQILAAENTFTFRFATLFGPAPRMRLDLLVNDFTYRAVRDRTVVLFEGHFKRNYLHVADAAAAFAHGLENFDEMKGQPYNCGLEEANLSKVELCQKIQEQLPKFQYLEAKIGEDPDKRNYIVSNERLASKGFVAPTSLDEGIRQLIQAFKVIRLDQHSNV